MKMMATLALGAAAAGCATIGPVTPAANGGTCRNDALAPFTGRVATAELGTEILRTSGAKTLQWVTAGMMVTMDFREDRVRVYLDEGNRVKRLSCG